MEKKVALVLLATVALGFWVTGLLFFTGNPFAQTEGTYHYTLTNVTVSVPLSSLDRFMNIFARAGLHNNYTEPLDARNAVYVHVGNITTIIKGNNWELFFSRIGNAIAGDVFLSDFRGLVINSPEVQWNPLVLNAYSVSLIIASVIVGLIIMPAYRKIQAKRLEGK